MTNETNAVKLAKFLARAHYVRELICLLEVAVNESGAVVETNAVKLEQFYDQIEAYDQNVKDNEREEWEAQQDENQGFQALTHDE